MRRAIGAALVLVAVLGAAGCSSSSPAAQQSQLPPSVAPATTVTTPASSTPPPSPSTSAKPLSAFEKDPAVIALRAWAAQAAKTVNSGHYTDKALQALMTPALAKTMKHVMGNVVGQHMPGPVPFTPIAVKRISARERYIDACFVTNGFAVNPKTGKHEHSRVVTAIDTGAHLVDGTWKTDAFFNGKFSCKGVAIPEPTW